MATKKSTHHSGNREYLGFAHYWELCEDDIEKQTELIGLFVEQIFVRDQDVVEIILKGSYQIQLQAV